jgi:hypothetical protein
MGDPRLFHLTASTVDGRDKPGQYGLGVSRRLLHSPKIAEISRDSGAREVGSREDFSMSKPGALTLFYCLAALPLIGCVSGAGAQSQAYPTVPR